MSCEQCCGFFCGSQPPGAGTGIRVTAVDENGLSDSLAQVQAIDNDRRRDDLIFREDTGNGTALFRDDEREVEQSGFLDAAMDAGCAEPLRCGDPSA